MASMALRSAVSSVACANAGRAAKATAPTRICTLLIGLFPLHFGQTLNQSRPNGRAFSGEPSERSERPERMRRAARAASPLQRHVRRTHLAARGAPKLEMARRPRHASGRAQLKKLHEAAPGLDARNAEWYLTRCRLRRPPGGDPCCTVTS